MGKTFGEITDHHRAWIARQSMFFVATAPLGAEGHVNVSPKGPVGSLQVLGPRHVAYLDVGGSGAETIAHVRENGRIVSCSARSTGRRGSSACTGSPASSCATSRASIGSWPGPRSRTPRCPARGARHRRRGDPLSDSCGYTVPLMSMDGVREHHRLSAAKRLRNGGDEGYWAHRLATNATSIDGLAALAGRDGAPPAGVDGASS